MKPKLKLPLYRIAADNMNEFNTDARIDLLFRCLFKSQHACAALLQPNKRLIVYFKKRHQVAKFKKFCIHANTLKAFCSADTYRIFNPKIDSATEALLKACGFIAELGPSIGMEKINL